MQEKILKIPMSLLKDLKSEKEEDLVEIFLEGLRKTKIRRALKMYKEGYISFGRAAKLSGLREDELSMEAYALGMEPPYSEETITEETKL